MKALFVACYCTILVFAGAFDNKVNNAPYNKWL